MFTFSVGIQFYGKYEMKNLITQMEKQIIGGGKETTTQVWSLRELYTKENYFEIITPIILIRVLEGLRLAPGRGYKERSGSWK